MFTGIALMKKTLIQCVLVEMDGLAESFGTEFPVLTLAKKFRIDKVGLFDLLEI